MTDKQMLGDYPLEISSGMADHTNGILIMEIIRHKYKLRSMGLFALHKVYSTWDIYHRAISSYEINSQYSALGNNKTAMLIVMQNLKEQGLVEYIERNGYKYWKPTYQGIRALRTIVDSVMLKGSIPDPPKNNKPQYH